MLLVFAEPMVATIEVVPKSGTPPLPDKGRYRYGSPRDRYRRKGRGCRGGRPIVIPADEPWQTGHYNEGVVVPDAERVATARDTGNNG